MACKYSSCLSINSSVFLISASIASNLAYPKALSEASAKASYSAVKSSN
jgi:hypothetical protein